MPGCRPHQQAGRGARHGGNRPAQQARAGGRHRTGDGHRKDEGEQCRRRRPSAAWGARMPAKRTTKATRPMVTTAATSWVETDCAQGTRSTPTTKRPAKETRRARAGPENSTEEQQCERPEGPEQAHLGIGEQGVGHGEDGRHDDRGAHGALGNEIPGVLGSPDLEQAGADRALHGRRRCGRLARPRPGAMRQA